ncbi:protein S-acyltransferase [Malassezia cuniculi]|uniref:Palmitoyltransferase n=1 Tax=Malassezia cuniculi TaxID=948313 RepID=A0AAF0ET55_9BASI|nr:protein S-acyltransferase [Malassezia cuniculi]
MTQPAWSAGGRAYEQHEGNVIFLLGGRLQTSRDNPLILLFTLALVFGGPIVWVAFEAHYVWTAISPAPLIIFAYVTLNAWASLVRTSFCDPGIIPRYLEDGDKPSEKSIVLTRVDDGGVAGSLETTIALQWCTTCHIYRPPRASHCRACNNCVDTIDHHCVFLNACIGRRNYAAFVSMLVHLFICIIISVVCSALHLYHVAHPTTDAQRSGTGSGFVYALRHEPQCIVFFWVGSVFLIPVSCLLTYHVWLITQNRTTIEQIRLEASGRIYDMERKDADCAENYACLRMCVRFSAWVRQFLVAPTIVSSSDKGNNKRRRSPFQRPHASQNAQAALGRAVPDVFMSWRDAPP